MVNGELFILVKYQLRQFHGINGGWLLLMSACARWNLGTDTRGVVVVLQLQRFRNEVGTSGSSRTC